PADHGTERTEPIKGRSRLAPPRGEFPRRLAVGGIMNAVVPLFRLEGVSKHYGGVRALEKANLFIEAGRVPAILGEDGRGKSTLIKVIAGVIEPDEGAMYLEGRQVRFARPADANAAGVACIFQELSLIPDLSVADNIVIANPPLRFGLIDRRRQRKIA